MTENNHQRPMLIASFSAFFAATLHFFAQEKSPGSSETPRLRPQLLHRVFLSPYNPPVDITVDKGTPPLSEKDQQNQHFNYHSVVRYSYGAVNNPLIQPRAPRHPIPQRAVRIITPVWNMHRSGAACSLNVTSIGIWLSRQHLRIYRNRAFFAPESTAAVDSSDMRDYSETDLWNSRGPRAKGFSRGSHESA